MIRKVIRSASFAGLGMLGLLISYNAAHSADDKIPDIEEIMKKGHAKKDGYLAKIGAAAKAGKWDVASKDAKSLVQLGEALGKNKPSKGTAKSWATLTKKYHDNTVAVEKAVEAKNAKGVAAAIGVIGKSCGECHKAHK